MKMKMILLAGTMLIALPAFSNEISFPVLDNGNEFMSDKPKFKMGWNVVGTPLVEEEKAVVDIPLFNGIDVRNSFTPGDHISIGSFKDAVLPVTFIRTGMMVFTKAGDYNIAVDTSVDLSVKSDEVVTCYNEVLVNGENVYSGSIKMDYRENSPVKRQESKSFTVSSSGFPYAIPVKHISKCSYKKPYDVFGGLQNMGYYASPQKRWEVGKNFNLVTTMKIKDANAEPYFDLSKDYGVYVIRDSAFDKIPNPELLTDKFNQINSAVSENPEFGELQRGWKFGAYRVSNDWNTFKDEQFIGSGFTKTGIIDSLSHFKMNTVYNNEPAKYRMEGYFLAKESGDYVFGGHMKNIGLDKTGIDCSVTISYKDGNKVFKTAVKPTSVINGDNGTKTYKNLTLTYDLADIAGSGKITLPSGLYFMRADFSCNYNRGWNPITNDSGQYREKEYIEKSRKEMRLMVKSPSDSSLRFTRPDELLTATGVVKKIELKESVGKASVIEDEEVSAPVVAPAPSPAPAEKVVKANDAKAIKAGLASNKNVDVNVTFATGKSDLDLKGQKVVAEIARAIADTNDTLVIEGHTDSVGDEKANLFLSQKRAESVRNTLIIVHGIDEKRLIPMGFGELRPRSANNDENRRVTIVKK